MDSNESISVEIIPTAKFSATEQLIKQLIQLRSIKVFFIFKMFWASQARDLGRFGPRFPVSWYHV